MIHLCIPLFLVMISGVPTQTAEEVRDVVGYKGDDVLLPCNCVNRDKERGFKWQTENPLSLIIKVNPTEEPILKNYKNRVETFANENRNDCSILLKKITEDDNKTYTCRFNMSGVSKVYQVNLKVIQRPATTPDPSKTHPPDHEKRIVPGGPPRDSWRYLTIIPGVAFLLLVGYFGNIYLKQQKNRGASNQEETSLSSEV